MALCSTEELGRLQSPVLALAVSRERLRLGRLHALLFRQPEGCRKEPSVSLDSFVWAHCLVRSRALDLTSHPVRGPAVMCHRVLHRPQTSGNLGLGW